MVDEVGADVETTLRKIWWLPVLRGGVLLVLGLLMLIRPIDSATVLMWIWGVFAVIDGVLSLGMWLGNRKEPGAGWWALAGIVGIVFGVIAMVWPDKSVTVVFYLIALWILVLGVLAIIASVTLYRARDIGWYWVLTFGLVSFLFGLLVLINPQETLAIVMVLLGLFAFVGGVVLIVSGFATRSFAQSVGRSSAVV